MPALNQKMFFSSSGSHSVAKSLTLCNLVDYTVHGILWARILEWVAFPFSRGSSQLRDRNLSLPHCRWILYQLSHVVIWVRNYFLKSNGKFTKYRQWVFS